MKKIALIAMVALGLVGCTALDNVGRVAQVAGYLAPEPPMPMYPTFTNEGGVYAQLFLKESGQPFMEWETPSNDRCVKLWDAGGPSSTTTFTCAEKSLSSVLPARGTARITATGETMNMRFLTRDGCLAIASYSTKYGQQITCN